MYSLFIAIFFSLIVFGSDGESLVEQFNYEVNMIGDDIRDQMVGVTWHEDCPIKLEELRHLELSYFGFDNRPHIGELIVNFRVVEDVVEIFRELYEAKFYIESMNLLSKYNGNDFTSMSKNNTSAFNCRRVPGTDRWSKHSYGVAIDINPVINPWFEDGRVLPKEGEAFLDRSKYKKGMILPGDACHKAFKNRGWRWGGDFNSGPDYQHFDKMY